MRPKSGWCSTCWEILYKFYKCLLLIELFRRKCWTASPTPNIWLYHRDEVTTCLWSFHLSRCDVTNSTHECANKTQCDSKGVIVFWEATAVLIIEYITFISLYQGWPDFFDRGPNLKTIFHLGPHYLKLQTWKIQFLRSRKKLVFFDA